MHKTEKMPCEGFFLRNKMHDNIIYNQEGGK